jgi:hypothetical protein
MTFMTRQTTGSPGSQTNASDAVDDIDLPPQASSDEVLDSGVMQTFPASDPVAVGSASERAKAREEAPPRGDSGAPAKRRSPDWLLDKKK